MPPYGNQQLRLPERYVDLSEAEMEYDGAGIWDSIGGFFGGIADTIGGAWGGFTDTVGGLWGGFTETMGGLWSGLTETLGGVWGSIQGIFGINGEDFSVGRNGWGMQSYFGSMSQVRSGISRYIASPM